MTKQAYFTGIRYINGNKYRFEPSLGELSDLVRRPYADTMTEILEGLPADVIAKAVAVDYAQHEQAEDKRIAEVEERHAMIRKNGVCMESKRTMWHTTNSG